MEVKDYCKAMLAEVSAWKEKLEDMIGPGESNRAVAWEDLTDEQKEFQTTKMAIHAAMVDRMDQGIGRIVAELKQQEMFDNTLIFFLQDNGGCAEGMGRGGADRRRAGVSRPRCR